MYIPICGDKNVHLSQTFNPQATRLSITTIPSVQRKQKMAVDQPSHLPKFLQEEDLTQECRDLISTLPKEKGWIASHLLYKYQGFWYNSRHIQGILSCQEHFQAHDTDIILITNPKSGTTWLKALTFALLNRKTYPDTQKNHPLLTKSPHALVPYLELSLYMDKAIIPDLSSIPSPRIFSTHLPYVSLPKSVKESNCKIVYLCRDPKDTFVSMWHFFNKLIRPEIEGTNSSLDECFEKFCRGVSDYGPFWEHVLGYWKESLERPEKIKLLRYEQMKLDLALILKELADFVGCPFSKEELSEGMLDDIVKLCSFDNLSNLDVNKTGTLPCGRENKTFFRRGEIGDWKNLLTIEMVEQLNTIVEKELAEHGLRF